LLSCAALSGAALAGAALTGAAGTGATMGAATAGDSDLADFFDLAMVYGFLNFKFAEIFDFLDCLELPAFRQLRLNGMKPAQSSYELIHRTR
jgi:hypothetical protein